MKIASVFCLAIHQHQHGDQQTHECRDEHQLLARVDCEYKTLEIGVIIAPICPDTSA